MLRMSKKELLHIFKRQFSMLRMSKKELLHVSSFLGLEFNQTEVAVPMVVTKRAREVQEIISDLESLKLDPEYREAAEINIGFFKATRSIFSLMHWLIFVAPELRKRRGSLLEMGDLPLEKWQKRSYEGLAGVERHKFASIMSAGFAKELCQIIPKMKANKNNDEAAVMLDLGFGGGELGRRVLEKLPQIPLVYIGVDILPANIALARKTFQPLRQAGEVSFKRVSVVNDELIETLRGEASASKKVVAVCLGDIFDLDKYVSPGKIDIIYHSRLLHHIRPVDRARLVDMCQRLSPLTVEMDDRYCFWFKFLTILVTWAIYPNPALMNGGIISCLRDPAKEELTGYFKLVPPFSYVRLILGQNSYFQDEKWETLAKTLVRGFCFKD